MELKGAPNSLNNIEGKKNKKVEQLTLSNFKT